MMTHVLSVPAGEVRNPITDLIEVVPHNLLIHHDLEWYVSSLTGVQTDVPPQRWLSERPSDLEPRHQMSR